MRAALVCLLAAAVYANPSVDDFFAKLGIDHLPVTEGGRQSHSYEKDGIRFKYDVEHHPSLVPLEKMNSLASIRCQPDGLHLQFESVPAALEAFRRFKAADDALVSGSRAWGCLKEDDTPVSILRKVHTAVLTDRNTVYLGTAPASFENAFRNAHISFTTSKFPEDHFKTVHMAPVAEEERIARRSTEGFVSNPVVSFFKRSWDGIAAATSRSLKAFKAIFKAVIALADGEATIDQTFYHDLFNWNFDHSTGRAVNPITPDPKLPWFVCEDCFANADLEVEFVLEVSNYQTTRLRLTAGGVTRFNALVAANFPGKFSKQWVVRIAEIKAAPIVFQVAGVPFVIDLIVPIDLEFDLMADISGKVTASANAGGFIRFGMDYKGNWDEAWITEKGLEYGATEPTLQLTSAPTVGLSVALFPNMHVKLDHIGGVSFGVRLIGTTALQLGCENSGLVNQEAEMSINSLDALASVDVGAQGLLGAFVDVKVLKKSILKKELDPLMVLAYTRRVALKCVKIGDGVVSSSNENGFW